MCGVKSPVRDCVVGLCEIADACVTGSEFGLSSFCLRCKHHLSKVGAITLRFMNAGHGVRSVKNNVCMHGSLISATEQDRGARND